MELISQKSPHTLALLGYPATSSVVGRHSQFLCRLLYHSVKQFKFGLFIQNSDLRFSAVKCDLRENSLVPDGSSIIHPHLNYYVSKVFQS